MNGYDLGSTSLYTYFEGGIGKSNFSYTIETHLLTPSPASLYENTFRSDEGNWLDEAYLTFSTGPWDFSAGKMAMGVGSYELDLGDYDVTPTMASTMWNNFQVYQWGVDMGFSLGEGNTRFGLQATTSPFGEKFFESGKYAYSVNWTGEYGPFSTITSANLIDWYDGEKMKMVAFAGQLALSDFFTVGLDANLRGLNQLNEEMTFVGTANWTPSEKFSVLLKGGFESSSMDLLGYSPLPDAAYEDFFVPTSLEYMQAKWERDYVFTGLELDYFPIEDLRLHAVAAINNFTDSVCFTAGATYYFDLAPLIRK